MKLRVKILIMLIPLIVLPLLTLGWIAYERFKSTAQQTSIEQMNTLLSQVALHVQTGLETLRSNVNLFFQLRVAP